MKPRYVISKTLVDGRTAWYWNPPPAARKAGLTAEALGCDHIDAFTRAIVLNSQWEQVRRKTGGPTPGTVAWGIGRYVSGVDFDLRKQSTQRIYLQALRHIDAVFGPHAIEAVCLRHADTFYDRLCRPGARGGKPRIAQANNVLRVARILWDGFLGKELAKQNPFKGVKMRPLAPRKACWTRTQVMRLAEAADGAGEPGLATATLLAFELCQRQVDVLSLTWDQIAGNVVNIVQSKTGAEVKVEMPEYLCRRLALQGRTGAHVVLRSDGEPWRDCINDFRRKFRRIADAANIPESLTFMDFRRSGITEMANAGATDNEILSVSGHKTREILKVYAKTNSAQAAHGLKKRRQFAVINGSRAD